MRRLAGAVLGVLLLAGCSSWDERQGHVCGDSPDAVCDDTDEAAEAMIDGPDVADGDSVDVDCDGTSNAAFPDVVDGTVTVVGDGQVNVSATLCSAYDTPERYADAWRVLTPDGEVLGVRELLHDHANEQPFTRSLSSPIAVPDGVTTLVVEGRDLVNGWGGGTLEVDLSE